MKLEISKGVSGENLSGIFQEREVHKCLVICPDKISFVQDNSKLSRTKILSMVKKSIFCFEKSFKLKFLIERTLKIYFQLEIFIMNGFRKQKIDFLTLDKISVFDNFNDVMEKNTLCRWTRYKVSVKV